MFEWFVIAVFVSLYVVFCIGLAIAILTIMEWASDLVWKAMRKKIPGLPEDRKEYYERTVKQLEDTAAKLEWPPNKDKH